MIIDTDKLRNFIKISAFDRRTVYTEKFTDNPEEMTEALNNLDAEVKKILDTLESMERIANQFPPNVWRPDND